MLNLLFLLACLALIFLPYTLLAVAVVAGTIIHLWPLLLVSTLLVALLILQEHRAH